jgi:hypothetical protein
VNISSASKQILRISPPVLFVVITLGLLLCYYGPGIFRAEQFYVSDHQLYFEPLARYIGNGLREFRLPLWNPYLHCGMSQAATPSPGIFYPPNCLFAFFSYGQALAWLMILHQLVAGLGAYLLVFSFGWGAAPAFAAGTIAAFSGYMMSLTTNHTLIFTAAWLPISLWALRSIGLCQSGRQLYLLVSLAGTTIFLIVAAGRPEVGVPALALVVLLVFSQLLIRASKEESTARRSNSLAWQCLALCCAALLAMAVVLPVAEWFFLSPRSQGIKSSYVFLWSANWYDLVAMVFAQPLGDFTKIGAPYLNVGASRPGYVPFLPSTLVGPVAATLALWGICDGSWRARKWTALVFSLSLIMMAGQNLPLIPKLIAIIPYATIFRYPIKLIIFPIFCIALLAGRGMWCIWNRKLSDKMLAVTAGLWLLCLTAGTVFAMAGVSRKAFLIAKLAEMPGAQLLLGQAILRGSMLGLLVCVLAFLVVKNRLGTKMGSVVLTVVLMGSLLIPAYYYRGAMVGRGYYSNRPYLLSKLDELKGKGEDLCSQRLVLLYFDPLKEPPGGFPGSPENKSFNYFQYYHDVLLPNTNVDWLQPETFGYEAAETKDFRDYFANALHQAIPQTRHDPNDTSSKDDFPLWSFCRATATTWVCSQIESPVGPVPKCDCKYFAPIAEIPSMNLRIYRVEKTLPRAFLSKNWCWVAAHDKVLEAVRDPGGSGFDPENSTRIERLPADAPSYSVLMPPGSQLTSSSRISENDGGVFTQQGILYPAKTGRSTQLPPQSPTFLKDSAEHISISANLAKPGFLVLSDQYYPGWTAHIDGVEAPVYRANGVFRAVYLPAGGHLIQFDYQPQSVYLGLVLASAGALIIVALLWAAALPTISRWLKLMSS